MKDIETEELVNRMNDAKKNNSKSSKRSGDKSKGKKGKSNKPAASAAAAGSDASSFTIGDINTQEQYIEGDCEGEGEGGNMRDYTVDWLLDMQQHKGDPVALVQLLDSLRTNDSMEVPPHFPPPPLADYDRRHGTSVNASLANGTSSSGAGGGSAGAGGGSDKFYYDKVSGKALPTAAHQMSKQGRVENNRTRKLKRSIPIFEEYETDTVQFMASELGYKAVVVHERARVLCFCRGSKLDNTYERVNVFYTVGTVGTACYPLPYQAPTQIFHRGVHGKGCK